MARTKQEIFDVLIALKDANAILSPLLTSESKSAYYRNIFDLVSEFGGDFELTYDDFVEQVETLMESKQVHNSLWWQNISLDFQLGDSLTTFDNGNLGYETEDESIQIVKRAAVLTSQVGAITLKVAKLDTDDITPIPLDVTEKTAFNGYIEDMGPAGIVPSIISVDGDEMQVGLEVIIDTQLINIDDGTLLSDGTTKPVEDAIYNYFSSFQGDGFGGTFYANNMLSDILNAVGVVSATYVTLATKASNVGAFTDVLTLTGKKFTAYSGYVKMEAAWDLDANITYIAE